MKIFIDGSIPSLFLMGELSVSDEEHLEGILLSHQAKRVEVLTIKNIKNKMKKIPELNLTQNNKFVILLKLISEVEEMGYCGGLRPGGIGGHEIFNPIYEKLINILDNLEARQIYQAISHECTHFLTLNKNILKKDLSNFNVQIVTPEKLAKKIVLQ